MHGVSFTFDFESDTLGLKGTAYHSYRKCILAITFPHRFIIYLNTNIRQFSTICCKNKEKYGRWKIPFDPDTAYMVLYKIMKQNAYGAQARRMIWI